ncbi:MAG: dependent oxidoreductase [Acidimicrobiaceae bacterium]|nr:dependent oxidoreductase [Acidimicrobiaceae bacterium]
MDLGAEAQRALAGTRNLALWLDDPTAPPHRPALEADLEVDLAVVGGGLTGLWTAFRALEDAPGRKVALLEGGRLTHAASGRNGGFVEASLTHGLANGAAHFPDEIHVLERLGLENLAGLASSVAAEGIECDLEAHATLSCATAPWQLEGLVEEANLARAHGHDVELLDGPQVRALVDSRTYLGALRTVGRSYLVNPARLAWGLAASIERRGGQVFESSSVTKLGEERGRLRLTTSRGVVGAERVVLATSAFRPLIGGVRSRVLPVWDYVLATEPLSFERLASIGWAGREGISDAGNRFHYYRLTADGRLVFGGFDAVYHYGNGIREELAERPATFALLAEHCLATFPQLQGVRFTHAWGGAIDTCSRFCAFFRTGFGGRVASAAGFTGLGLGASRFAAGTLLDLVDNRASAATELDLVRRQPIAFPPEPLRSAVGQLTRWSLARADEHDGRRNLWLKTLDAAGLGFDS